jgi:transporter family-2 protein
VPWYAFTAGALGLVIVGTIGYVVPRLGIARSLTLIIASQLLLAALIDHFGIFGADLRPMDGPRALGMVAVLAGAWLAVR